MGKELKKDALVSAIIPVYNRGSMAIEAVESALGQTYPNLEVIVVDDGSEDDSLEILQQFNGNPRVKIIHQENAGVSAARNRGIEAAQGEYIALLDSDDLWTPDKTERQLVSIKDSDAGMIYSNCRYMRLTSEGNWVTDSLYKKSPRHKGHIFEKVIEDKFIRLSTVIIPRNVFRHSGLFCEDMRTSEDRHLFARIAHDYFIEYLEEPLAVIRRHTNNLSYRSDVEPDTMKFFNKIASEYSLGSQKWFREAYAKNARSSAIDAFFDRRMKQARREFREACRYKPAKFSNWLWLAATLLPVPFLNAIRNARHGNKND